MKLTECLLNRLRLLSERPRAYGAGCSANQRLRKLGLAERTGQQDPVCKRPIWRITEAGRNALAAARQEGGADA